MAETRREDMETWQVRYLLVLTDEAYFDELMAECAALAPRVLFRQPQAVSVVEVTSRRSYPSLLPSPHSLIEADLGEMRNSVRFLGASYLEIAGNVVGHRWPVLVAQHDDDRCGPELADFSCSWDHLILRHADAVLADRMLDVAGRCLALYYILRSLVMLTRDVAEQLLADGSSDDDQFGVSAKLEELSLRRDLIRSTEILADARPALYWGCEHRLYNTIRDAWGIDSLAASAHESAEVTAQILTDRRDREMARRAAQSAAASHRSSIALLLLTLIAGISAVAALIDFAVSSGDPTFLVWRLIVSGALLFVVPVLVYVNRAALARSTHASTVGSVDDSVRS